MLDDEIMKMVSRVNSRVEELEQENEKLQSEIYNLKDESEYAWSWARHFKIDEDKKVPVPRLEIRYHDLGGWYNYTATYGIVYRHLTGYIEFVPLGQTKIGGHGEKPFYNGKPRLPFRDGAHIQSEMKQFGLPAYSYMDGVFYQIKQGER